ncbi:MAG: AAA family ATPase [Actinobacteria bacterium]|nr:AAA family ATPase [Actinomycetota bacterium]
MNDSSPQGVLDSRIQDEESALDRSLRPTRLEDFVGQGATKEHLSIILDAAQARSEAPDHLLFAGSPGLGKTTLANIVAGELGVNMRTTSGPALERAGDLDDLLRPSA